MQTDTNVNEIIENNPIMRRLRILDRAQAKLETDETRPEELKAALDAIFDGLEEAHETMSREDWLALAKYARAGHELSGIVQEDPMTKRALDKPRGYAGDAIMMDYLYGIHSSLEAEKDASARGREIYHYIQSRPAGQAVRYRREHIAKLIDELAERKNAEGADRPDVLAIAAGHLREAELTKALEQGRIGRFVSLDADAESLREVETRASKLGVETVHGSVRHILARKVKLGLFDFVYAAGLYDYLENNVATALTARMFEMTKPGGQMLIPNFAPKVHDRAYMEVFMDWTLIYRDENQMACLLAEIDPVQIAGFDVYSDPTESVVYLLVRKAAA